MAWWRRSWKRSPGRPASRVKARQAVRHVDIGFVGSGLTDTVGPGLPFGFATGPCPSPCGKRYQLGCGCEPSSSLARSRNSKTAAHASSLIGITRSPASVLLRRTVKVRSMKFTSRHWRPRISDARMVVFSATTAASRASCHSGFFAATSISVAFSSRLSARPTFRRSGRSLISSAIRCQRLARLRMRAKHATSMFIVRFDRFPALRSATYFRTESAVIRLKQIEAKQVLSGFRRSFSVWILREAKWCNRSAT